jgi:hypothetical protein
MFTVLAFKFVNFLDFIVSTEKQEANWDLEKGENPILEKVVVVDHQIF